MSNPSSLLGAGRLPAPPLPSGQAGRRALRALLRDRNLLAALQALHQELGDIFQLVLPGFKPVVMVGPEANRFVLVDERDKLRWRSEADPVTRLLRHGILVEDGPAHDRLRADISPALHRNLLQEYVETMTDCTEQVCAAWPEGARLDMLVEMRRIALLILVQTLFKVDFRPDLARLWRVILDTIAYISPGPWLIWPQIPRPGYRRAIRQVDAYLFQIIRARRADLGQTDDLLGLLIATPGMSDDLIRDQLLTMLIAGHDTSTALLAWTLYLLGKHPGSLAQAQAEVDLVLGSERPTLSQLNRLNYLERVIKESMRLYPPIHLGQRVAATDLTFRGYHIPAGTRVLYSIYLTHRQPAYWPDPTRFDPDRFGPQQSRSRPSYSYLPFGGGPRNCIGAAFGLVEVKVVLARLLQHFNLTLIRPQVHLHMGATLEPRPGVMMRARPRRSPDDIEMRISP